MLSITSVWVLLLLSVSAKLLLDKISTSAPLYDKLPTENAGPDAILRALTFKLYLETFIFGEISKGLEPLESFFEFVPPGTLYDPKTFSLSLLWLF